MENDYKVKIETMDNEFVATEDVREEIISTNPDNSLSMAALIAYLLS